MKILVCDDEKIITEQVERIILERFPGYSVSCAHNTEAVVGLCSSECFDVVFLDIVLKDENGIDIGLYLSRKMPDAKIIFISGYQDRVSEIFFSLSPFGFVDKPINPDVLCKYLELARDEKEKLEAYFTYTEKGQERKLRYRDICYVESSREKMLVNTADSCFHVWKKISEVESDFPDYFVRCHKSYLVNMRYVVGIEKQAFRLMNGKEIGISRSKKNETEINYFRFKGGIV